MPYPGAATSHTKVGRRNPAQRTSAHSTVRAEQPLNLGGGGSS